MAIYYHGTEERNRRAIEDGWMGTEDTADNLDLSSGRTTEDGFVFLTTNKEYAAGYGDCIFVVDTEIAEYWRECPVTGEKEYRARANELNEEGAWWVDREY